MAVISKNVFSSHIDRVSYDDAKQVMKVTYQNGKTSVYAGVTPDAAKEVFSAESVGKAIHKEIRGQFEHSYLED